MRHLTPTELLDFVEQSPLATPERTHLESCATCRKNAAQLTDVLARTREVEVPEPSPLFWDGLSNRVREAIAVDPPVRRDVPLWAPWPALAPLAGLAFLVLALVSGVALHRAADDDEGAITMTADSASDSAWALVADLIGTLDVETARDAGIASAPGAADQAVLQLSAAEQEELVRLLRQELEQPGG